MTATTGLSVAAPAKINLFLRVLGLRSDGFHELETLFQAVDLLDDVVVTRTEAGVELDVEGADLGPKEENLAYRAARAYLDAAGASGGLHVRLTKRIPAGAGLGGGSSDAAAVLRAAEALHGAALGPVALHEVGASLGSDVPFFLGPSPLARATGRGERLEPLAPLPEASLVLVLPPVHVATGAAYGALARARAVGGERPCFGHFGGRPASWAEVALEAVNDFEVVVPGAHPRIRIALAALREAGGVPALLSGSGSACFGVFPDEASARSTASALAESLGCPTLATRTLSAWPEPIPTFSARGG